MLLRLQNEVHLWLEIRSSDDETPPTRFLSPSELQRAQRIRHPEARRQFVAGRHLLRRALSHYLPLEPSAWTIEETPLGRPELAGPEQPSRLRFNLSHSGDLITCIVTDALDCGVDVEALDRPIDALRIARHSFHTDEVELLETLEDGAARELFFSLWTLKESYLKAKGSGIRLRLDSAWFEISPSGAISSHFLSAGERAGEWRFSLFEPALRHRLATAVRVTSGPMPVTVLTLAENGEPKPYPARLLATG